MRIFRFLIVLMLSVSLAYADSYTVSEPDITVKSGNVGIGTYDPRSGLDVVGSASFGNGSFGGISTSQNAVGLSDAFMFLKFENNAASTVVTDTQSLVTCTSSTNTSNLTATGKINLGFLFNGAVNVNCGAITPTGAFTYNVWIKSGSSGDANGVLFGNRSSTGSNIGFKVQKSSNAQKVTFQLDTVEQNNKTITSTTTINTGAWFMLTIDYDQVNMRLFINNVLEATTPLSGDGGTGAGALYLDYSPIGGTSRWIGYIDNLLGWPRVLSNSERGVLYGSGNGIDVLTGSTGTVSATLDVIKGGNYPPLKVSSAAGGGGDYLTVASDGNVGIGTTDSITTKVKVVGTVAATAYTGDGSALTGILGGKWVSGTIGINTTSPVGIGTVAPIGGLVVMNGNVGIGTWSPVNNLQINGTTQMTGFRLTTNPSAGYVLTSSSVGIGTWMPAAAGGGGGTECASSSCDLNAATTIGGATIQTGAGVGGWTDGGTNVYASTTTDNVGIGTTTPNAATLEIVKNANQPLLKISSTATGGGNYLIVSSAGSVGVGTVTPSGPLNVSANSSTVYSQTGTPTTRLSITNQDTTINNTAGLVFQVMASDGTVTSGSDIVGIANSHTASSETMGMAFRTKNTGTLAERVRISSAGNVGIGTLAPASLLDVNRKFNVFSGGNVGIGTMSPMNTLQLNGTFQVDQANSLGWSIQLAANQACNTTCVSAAVVGLDQGTLGAVLPSFVGPTDATADQCLCAGPS